MAARSMTGQAFFVLATLADGPRNLAQADAGALNPAEAQAPATG